MRSGLYFFCKIGRLDELTFDVVDFTLEESLSTLFTLTLNLSSKNRDINLSEQLLKPVQLTIFVDGVKQRTINGIVGSAERGDIGFKRSHYIFTIHPEAWQLTLSKDSRIFHFKSVPEILNELLQKYNIVAGSQFMDPHPVREYVTQKRETDYDFFCRLAAEEGIMFWFEEEQMFYSDSHLGMTAGLDIIYNPHPQASTKEYTINQLKFGSFMRPNETTIKDYRYSHPDVPLNFKSQNPKNLPIYAIYDSYGRFDNEKMAAQFAKYRLEALQADSEQGQAVSNAICLRPGKIFQLHEHPASEMNDRWQIVKIIHVGQTTQSLDNESDKSAATLTNNFSFIPGRNDWRPPFIHKPLADGDEVASVAGPVDEEIYVNEDGAVKIHFHWNRYDSADENASCWVRVIQNWNGNGFGFLSTPRIGQEVIISYLNGDIDRPIIVGTTYNGNNRPPLALPAAKTQMSIKSKTHKGEGFNEIRFEDEGGKQGMFLHAQKDMTTDVLNDRTTNVKNDHVENVDNNQTMKVGVDQSLNVGSNQTNSIGTDQTNSIGANQASTIGSNQTLDVGVDQTETVGSNRTISIGANDVLTVTGNQEESITGTQTITVTGAQTTTYQNKHEMTVNGIQDLKSLSSQTVLIQGTQETTVNSTKTVTIHGLMTENFNASHKVNVSGTQDIIVTAKQTLQSQALDVIAAERIVLGCGAAQIILESSGDIQIIGTTISVAAQTEHSIVAPKVHSNGTTENIVEGAVVKLNP